MLSMTEKWDKTSTKSGTVFHEDMGTPSECPAD